MHELLLYGQIPAGRHDQLLNILAGLSAMQPQPICERHVLFRPTSLPNQTGPAKGGSQDVAAARKAPGRATANANQDVFYVELVEEVDENGGEIKSLDDGEGKKGKWKMILKETPAPGRTSTILRFVSETEILSGDAQGYVEGLGYTHVQETILQGHQFILSNTILTLHRILTYPNASSPKSIPDPIPSTSSLQPLDPSGAYVLEAKVRVSEAAPALVSRAETELLGFADRMRGVIDMQAPERLSLDTRHMAQRPRVGMAARPGAGGAAPGRPGATPVR